MPEESRGDTTNPVKRVPRRSANACETPVEGTLRRLPVPGRAPRNISLRVEETPRDTGAHDHLLEGKNVQKALGRAQVSAPEVNVVDKAPRRAQATTPASKRDASLRAEADPRSRELQDKVSVESTPF